MVSSELSRSFWIFHLEHTRAFLHLNQHSQEREVETLTHGLLFGGPCARGWGGWRTWACLAGSRGGAVGGTWSGEDGM